MIEVEPALLAALGAHAASVYPAECCGVLLDDAAGALRYQPIANVAGTAAGAGTSTRTARDGYVMDPLGLMNAIEGAEARGGGLRAIVHSHPEVGAYFSAEDQRAALGGGDEPLWPGIEYLVISCRKGRSDDFRIYRWDAVSKAFHERILALPDGI